MSSSPLPPLLASTVDEMRQAGEEAGEVLATRTLQLLGDASVTLSRTCTIGQVRRIVGHHLHALWFRPDRARTLPPLMIWGPLAVGKSEVIYQVCAEERRLALLRYS